MSIQTILNIAVKGLEKMGHIYCHEGTGPISYHDGEDGRQA